VDHRADIFALGLILNEMFTGTVPLGADHPLVASATPQYGYIDEVVTRMIRHLPGDRPGSILKIKEELLARGNEFVAFQKLDEAKRAVVPTLDPEDPLNSADIDVTGCDYEAGTLTLMLKPAPPARWMQALQNIGTFRSYPGHSEPRRVNFVNGRALIPANEQTAAGVLQMFKEWVVAANVDYRNYVKQEAEQRGIEARRRFAENQRRADEKARVMQKLREQITS